LTDPNLIAIGKRVFEEHGPKVLLLLLFYFPWPYKTEPVGVTYVLDESVRKSGTRLRVAARLIRADNGYVVWTETYDRSLNDILMVQDDIAGEVTKALRASIEARPDDGTSHQ
jgi:hypothetical protein